ncbi:MAG: formate dehydrogenase accessory protein FdhE [Anaeromyxobacter sp.]|nr:formate dehydrogenase accessory protein FdhE [Anaeromyxobacter sp.]MBL0278661.1 formate dehydrogenase accessory protein FdhE [Anaeromyxobacter sp.]
MDETRRRWLAAHPFLVPLAHLQGLLERAVAATPAPALDLPAFGAHAPAAAAGLPLLRGPTHGPLLRAAGAELLGDLLARVAAVRLPGPIAAGAFELRAALATPGARALAITWLVEGEPAAPPPPQPGLLRYLGWTAFGRALAPAVADFAAARDERAWRRPICPTCGALPVMAHLVDHEAGHERRLVCGCCADRWSFERQRCPSCGNQAADRLGLLEFEGPAALRLDTCEACRGYLKVYTGRGEEALFLADWPTLVLDAMAAERGYLRRGASLFEL